MDKNSQNLNIDKLIIHIDMDAFYASVEMRDNPNLKGKPLIIGALPNQRGVVATCSYEARKFGIHSAMNIKEAYKLCPKGIYLRPDMNKYRKVSEQIRSIWKSYTPIVETVALDEAYLDITDYVENLSEARQVAKKIKQNIKEKLNLTCSVGLAYCKTAAKTASEEKKPNGYFEILTPQDFVNLIIDRNVRALHTVGPKTAEKLYSIGIYSVRDVRNNKDTIISLLGKQGQQIVNYSFGIDGRQVIPYRPQDAKSISREVTFQKDVSNFNLLKDVLVILAICVEKKAKQYGLVGNGITLKITYNNMHTITRSFHILNCDKAYIIWKEAVNLLENIEHLPVRLVGVGIHSLKERSNQQISFFDKFQIETDANGNIYSVLKNLNDRYGLDFEHNIDKLSEPNILHKTIEYMRNHFNDKN